jgi:hypothetical protein
MLRRLHQPPLAYSCALTRSRLNRIDPDIRFLIPYQPAASSVNIQSCQGGGLRAGEREEIELHHGADAQVRPCTHIPYSVWIDDAILHNPIPT